MTRDEIRARLDSKRWQALHRGVYLTNTGAPTWTARASAALLHAGAGAALSLHTAAFHTRLTTKQPPLIQVYIPASRRVSPIPGVSVRRKRAAYDSYLVNGLRTTRVRQTVIDIAAEPGESADGIVSLVARVCQAGSTTTAQLKSELDTRRAHARRELLELALASVEEGVESVAEFRCHKDVIRAHALPRMVCQAPTGDGGRRDFESDYGLILEIDGALWHQGAQLRRDRSRDRAATREGKITLRAGWTDVAIEPCLLAVDIALVLRQLGWDGWPKPCSPTCAVHDMLRTC